MVLATREDAQFLSDAVQGAGDPLSVLQEFERSHALRVEMFEPKDPMLKWETRLHPRRARRRRIA